MLGVLKKYIKLCFRPSLILSCDNLALQHLRSFDFGYLPWSVNAIRPATLCVLLNEIVVNRRRCVVEFGSGLSTLYLGRVLQDAGGTLISFDHDIAWIELVRGWLEKHKLAETVHLVLAPLKRCSQSPWNLDWYDLDIVTRALEGKQVDGMLVDGPPANTKELTFARYPALPAVERFLAPEFFCCLDDIGRAGEQEVFARWQSQLGLTGQIERIAGSFGMIRRGPHFEVDIAHIR